MDPNEKSELTPEIPEEVISDIPTPPDPTVEEAAEEALKDAPEVTSEPDTKITERTGENY